MIPLPFNSPELAASSSEVSQYLGYESISSILSLTHLINNYSALALGITHVEDIPLLQGLTFEWDRQTSEAASQPVGQSDGGTHKLWVQRAWNHCHVAPKQVGLWSETGGI